MNIDRSILVILDIIFFFNKWISLATLLVHCLDLLFELETIKIFMGDVGSNFLGGVLVWSILNAESIKNSTELLLIASPILLDPLICLIRRLINKQNIFKAHSLHLYQRLNKGGLDHSQISIIYILASLCISISIFIGGFFMEVLQLLLSIDIRVLA